MTMTRDEIRVIRYAYYDLLRMEETKKYDLIPYLVEDLRGLIKDYEAMWGKDDEQDDS